MADPKVFFEDGTPVPDEQIQAAVASGKAFVEQGASLNMLDEAGVPVKIAAENVEHALAAGYQVEDSASASARQSRREHTTAGQMALAGAEGLARGATVGLSDAALVRTLGESYRQGAQARQQENRLVAGAGEVVGAVGGALATGGLSGAVGAPARVVASAGRAAEAGVAGLLGQGTGVLGRAGARAASLGVAGAVEGSMYGAGQAVSRAALDDTQLSAEKVVASMGEGAVLGGLGGAVLGGAIGGVSGAVRAAGKSKSLQQGARELANESALKAAGAQGSDFRRIVGRRTGEAAERRIDELGQELLHYEFKSGQRQGQRLFRSAVKAEDLVDDVVYARQETGEALGAIRNKLDETFQKRPDLAPDVKRYLEHVDEDVLKPLRESNVPAVRARAGKVDDQLSLLRERLEPPQGTALVNETGVENLKYLRDGMRDMSSFRKAYANATPEEVNAIALGDLAPKGSVTGKPFEPISVDVYADGITSLRDGRHRMTAAREAGADRVSAKVRFFDADGNVVREELAPLSIRGEARQPITFRELEQVRRDLRSVFQPPKSSAGGIPAQPPEHAAALEQAERLLSSHLDDAAENALSATGQDVGEYVTLKKQYSNLRDIEDLTQKAELQQVGNRAVSPSDYATGMGTALGALMSGNVGAIGYGVAAGVAHKLIRERGRSTIAVLADSVASMNSGLDSAARRFAGALTDAPKRAVTPLALGAGEVVERFQQASTAVRDFQQPEQAEARLAAPVQRFANEYPTLAQGVQEQIMRSNTFLASKLPTGSTRAAASFTPEVAKSRIPVSEMQKFLRFVRGATQPAEVVEDLSHGKLDRQGLEAMKAVYPEMFGELRTRVMTYAAERGDEMPFNQRILLSLVFDYPGDKSLAPAYAREVQVAFAENQAEEPDSGRAVDLDPKMAGDMQTETQRVASR